MIYAGWFLVGFVAGMVAIIVISVCAVAGKCDDEEERRGDRRE